MNDGARTDSASPFIMETDGGCAVIRFNRPAERNPLSLDTISQLETAFDALTSAPVPRPVIFTGAGDVFASGADIRELRALTPDAAREFAGRGQRFFQKIAEAETLTIAAVNGYCMGGGLDLALACRLRVAAPGAIFAHPGARLGIITGWGGTQRLARLVGTARAVEMFTTAKRVTADEALEIGLVSRVGADALACALELASRLARAG